MMSLSCSQHALGGQDTLRQSQDDASEGSAQWACGVQPSHGKKLSIQYENQGQRMRKAGI